MPTEPDDRLSDDIKRIADACDDRDDTLSDDAFRDECAMRFVAAELVGRNLSLVAGDADNVVANGFCLADAMVAERARRRA